MTSRRGLFVVFEGGDGTGKSTQQRLLASALAEHGVDHVVTFEPGDSWLGRQVRGLVLDPASGDITPRAEALLYIADKAQHVAEVVEPALSRGAVVLCDRYVDSTLAYQGAGRVLDVAEVESIARWATGDLRPDLTVLLDLEPESGLATIDRLDRIEAAGADLHRRVRAGFLRLADRDPQRYLVLPARSAGPEAIAARVLRRLVALDHPWPSSLLALALDGGGRAPAGDMSDPDGRIGS